MATQIRASQPFRYRSFHINKGQPLGRGAYGAVYEAKCDQLTCAAKVLHPTILDPLDPGAAKIMQRFEQECAFLESIRHPNIVQYLGVTTDPESKLPVLLMELLDESLTKMLERSRKQLPYFIEVAICHDIALAVAYLHANDIIHRDLSSNNVLIVAKCKAKVTDFGMSRMSGAVPSMTPLTMCPGTQAYMPPEALQDQPTYTKKVDCFSEGVMMIQVCTRLWPEPGPRTKTVQDSRSPTGTTLMPILEQERRKNHIAMIDHGHGLLPVALDCLSYLENERPSSEELCERLADIKETREYMESMEQVEKEQNSIADMEKHSGETQAANVQQLTFENQQLRNEIQSKEKQHFLQIQELNQNYEKRESHYQSEIEQLNKQLQEQEQVTTEIQHTLQTQVEHLQKQLSENTQLNTKPPQPPSPGALEAQVSGPTRVIMLGEWKDGGKAPIEMSRGAAVVDGNVAYFMHWNGQIYSYNKAGWCELPRCPCSYSSLANVGGLLTAIGGVKDGGRPQNKLHSYVNKKWVERFPSMPTKRYYTAAVATRHDLIVAGGELDTNETESSCVNTVEILDIQNKVWSTAASLPYPYFNGSATICGDKLYMLGGVRKDGRTKSVLACSLKSLLQSCSQASTHSVWNTISDAPVYRSTCINVEEELLIVGGRDIKQRNTAAVHKYKRATDSWELISKMPTARYHCLVVVLPANETMVHVVGGSVGGIYSNYTDQVETVNIHCQ